MSLRNVLSTALGLGALVHQVAGQSAGCGGQPSIGDGVHSINGREYTISIPENYDPSNPYQLVFGFHWLGASMNDVVFGNSIEPWYGLEARSGGSAIFVAPNGNDAGWANPGGQDVAFVDAIIEAVEAEFCVDQSRRFATGFSYGGGMSYALACSRASQFRAVSILGAGLISGCDGGNEPIAYLGIHGIHDGVLSIDGGIGLMDRFVQNNGCQPTNVERPAGGSGQHVRTDFSGCSQPVSFIAYDGGHDGAPFGPGNPLGPESTWEFFMSS